MLCAGTITHIRTTRYRVYWYRYHTYIILQASSLSVDGSGKVPGLSKLIHNTSNLFCGNDLRVKDHNNVIEYIAKQHSLANDFPFIVTRPGWRKNGPPKKKLHASKSVRTVLCDHLLSGACLQFLCIWYFYLLSQCMC